MRIDSVKLSLDLWLTLHAGAGTLILTRGCRGKRYLGTVPRPFPFYYQATMYVLRICVCVWCRVQDRWPSGADDAGGAGETGIWIPCTAASTVPPNKDESHHSKATSRGASRMKKHLALRALACPSRPPSHRCVLRAHLRTAAFTCAAPSCNSVNKQSHSSSFPNPGNSGSSPGRLAAEGASCQAPLLPGYRHSKLETACSLPLPPIATTPPGRSRGGVGRGAHSPFPLLPWTGSLAG